MKSREILLCSRPEYSSLNMILAEVLILLVLQGSKCNVILPIYFKNICVTSCNWDTRWSYKRGGGVRREDGATRGEVE